MKDTKPHEIGIRSRKNVRENGEVFTPFSIVEKMLALIPEDAWADPSYCFLEPTCGNGQFLIKIFERRIAAGIPILTTLNTMVGMDISQENIKESHFRLFEAVCARMKVEGIRPKTREWYKNGIRVAAIVTNNIFKVKDSLSYIQTGQLEKKKFFYEDPTGSGQVLSTAMQQAVLRKIHEHFVRHQKQFKGGEPSKELVYFSPFFLGEEGHEVDQQVLHSVIREEI